MDFICVHWPDLTNIKTLVEIFALFLGGYILVFVFLQFHPNMILNIVTEWADKEKTILLVKIEIKNISKVWCRKNKVLIQFLEYPTNFKTELSEWVPFEEKNILYNEQPIIYSNPKEILTSTEFWYPGDIVKIERAYKCQHGRTYKIGLQLIANISLLGRISKRFRKGKWKRQEQWTTTKIICNI